jgi:hypothetical protein
MAARTASALIEAARETSSSVIARLEQDLARPAANPADAVAASV